MKIKNIFFTLVAVASLSLFSCTKEDEHTAAPEIESVWMNMVNQTIEPVTFAYPGQTLCIHGSGFGTLSRLIVNGDDINLNTLYVFETENYITFQLPSGISTTGDFIRVVTGYGMHEYPFIVRPTSQKPVINDFIPSLIPGTVFRIYGKNLEGAYQISLPLTFDRSISVDCEYVYDPEAASSAQESVTFTVPA